MASKQTDVTTDISEIQDLDITKNPIKVTKLFLESFLSDMKTQFDSLKNAFIDLKTSVKSDVKDLAINIIKATEIAVAAKSIAESNTTSIIELRTNLKAELKEELGDEILELKSKINEMKSELCSVKIKYRNLERDFEDVKSQTNNIETYSRKDNIVLYEIAEKQNESNDECATAVRKFMVEVLNIPQDRVNGVVFIRCHHIRLRARTCPIIVCFREFKDRELVWSRLKQIPKNKGVTMTLFCTHGRVSGPSSLLDLRGHGPPRIQCPMSILTSGPETWPWGPVGWRRSSHDRVPRVLACESSPRAKLESDRY